jgi:drug/metabolite transporter (DMT)-like permease
MGIPNYLLIFMRSIFTILIFLSALLVSHFYFKEFAIRHNLIKPSYPEFSIDYLASFVICCWGFGGLFYFTSSLRANKFSLIAPLANLGFVFTILTAFLVYQTPVSITQGFAFILFGIATVVVFKEVEKGAFHFFIVPVLLTHFFWDIAIVFYPFAIGKLGVIPFCLMMEMCVCMASGMMVLVGRPQTIQLLFKQYASRASFMALMICTAVFLLTLSLVHLSVVLVVALGLFTKFIRLSYGYFFLNERLNKTEIIMLMLMIAGGILASI